MKIGSLVLVAAAVTVAAALAASGGRAAERGRPAAGGAARLYLRIQPPGQPPSLDLPTAQTYVATPATHRSFSVVALLVPRGNLPKDTYIKLEARDESGTLVASSTTQTNPAPTSLYGCPAQSRAVPAGGFDWTWRATYWHHSYQDELLATSNTVRTTCVYRAGTFRSGTYDAVTTTSGKTYRGVWEITVSAGKITGRSRWTCCPGPRTDPLTGSTTGDRVVVVRRFAGQGAPPGSQTYTGHVVAPGRVTGTFSGSSVAPGATFSLTLRR